MNIHMQSDRHICAGLYAINGRLCIPVPMEILFIALISYSACILTKLSDMYM